MKTAGSAMERLTRQFNDKVAANVPAVGSFMEFLKEHAMVKLPGGEYVKYSFEGREALIPIVETFDLVLGSHTGVPLPDATIDICGGAQFGKTILALNFGAYLTACRFMNWGYYLPDDDLVEGIVDSKLRPDVIEQIDWLGSLMQAGKGEDKRGKVVNRKGAFMMTDGKRKSFGMVRGMGKIPTSFSMDVAMEDEKDDIPPKRSKFLTGRLTASNLRLKSSIGTQRLHAAGQQKQWEDGSQGVFLFDVGNGRRINLEENWPEICRMAVDGTPKPTDPKLTNSGDFRSGTGKKEKVWAYDPSAVFYFADPDTGAVVDRTKPILEHRRPDRIKLRKWSFRISQFAIGGLSIHQFVSRWQDAIRDPEVMVVFCCDVKAMPANTEQALSPEILKRARTIDAPYDLSLAPAKAPRFGGLDTGNRCWFVTRESESDAKKRIQWAEEIPLSQMIARTTTLFHRLGLTCLAIDANPAVDEARTLCYRLNGVEDLDWKKFTKPGKKAEDTKMVFRKDGLTWDGESKRWTGLRCFVVEFTRKPGEGITHKLGKDPQGGYDKFYPIIQANRFDSISRAVNEFLTPDEGVIRLVDGKLLEEPVMRLPRKETGSPPIVELMDAHFLTGSKREKDDNGALGDFVDKCENHLLLGDTYSGLAEMEGGHVVVVAKVEAEPVEKPGRKTGRRSL